MIRLAIAFVAAALSAGAQSRPQNIHVATLDIAAGRLVDRPQVVSSESAWNYAPMWSPDGKLLAYMSGELGADKQKLVVRSAVSGGIIREVRVQLGSFAPLVWTGDSLYGQGWSSLNGTGIYRVDAQTGADAPFYMGPVGPPNLRVSRDGKSVFFGRYLENGEIALITREIATGKEREIMRREWFQGIGVSQNGQYIVTAGIDRATNSRTALLISVESGVVREVLRVGSDLMPSELKAFTRGTKFRYAEWVTGGRSFVMLKELADETQDDELWEVPLKGTPRKLDFRLPRGHLGYRLQPGGSKIAWVQATDGTSGRKP